MTDTPTPDGGRCTLNGFLNNYVECFERLDAAVRETRESDPAPDWALQKLREGKSVGYHTDTARDRALRQYDQDARSALESWYVPSLNEARDKNVLPAIAPVLLEARRAIDGLRERVWSADGASASQYIDARDAALSAFHDLEALRPLILQAEGKEHLPVEGLQGHPGELTTGLAPGPREAWASFERAVKAERTLAESTDKAVYKWIVQNDVDSGYAEGGFETWDRYLRTARTQLGQSKYARRSGRTGRSIVLPDGTASGPER